MDYKNATIKSYNKIASEYSSKVSKLHPKKEFSQFFSMLRPKASVLDIGCGSGRDAFEFAKKGFKIIGIDLSPKMIAIARNKAKKADFKVMDLERLEFKAESFDGIWANAVYLHIPKKRLKKAFAEAKKALKKGGIMYISAKKGMGEHFLPDKRYNGVEKFWSYYSKKELESRLRDSGFKVIKSYVKRTKDTYSTHPYIIVFCRKS